MGSRRLTIAGMMGVVLVCAVGFSALRSATFLWVQITFSIALTVLLIASVGALWGRDRTFWRGFVMWGWAYALLSLGPWFSEEIEPRLLTTRLLNELCPRLTTRPINEPFVEYNGAESMPRMIYISRRFRWIGHALFCLLHGLVGGFLACLFARRASEPSGTAGRT